jgi:hypothetical protein
LPRALPGQHVSEIATASGRPAPSIPRGGKAILVVAGSPHMEREVLRQLPEPGYRALMAKPAETTLETPARSDHINQLVTDIPMPGQKDDFDLAGEALVRQPVCKVSQTKQGLAVHEVLDEETRPVPSALLASRR